MTNRKTGLKSEQTRQRIVQAAAAAYREHGIDGVGVRDIMKRAGLTQGGFYFHFADKDELFKEAAREAALGAIKKFTGYAESAPPGKKLEAFIDGYLSAEHRDHPEAGCMMSALGGEAGRVDAKMRAAFNDGVAIMLDLISAYVPGETPAERRQKAGLLMSSMAGVLMVARVLDDPKSSDRLLANSRRFFSETFGER
jgi:TetR/AcrR family transcriptional repressor of nem operon